MPYQAEISRDNPTCFLFVIDQSGSMDEVTETGRTKANFVADVLNKTLYTLVTNCSKADGVRNYFDVGVIAYGGSDVATGFGGALSGSVIHSINAISENTLRVEERRKKVDDGAGGVVEQKTKFPIWFDAKSAGGTPMRAGLSKTMETVADWCDAHARSYPPTILHVTDGQSTDGAPEEVADGLRQMATSDGPSLLFNLHVTGHGGLEIVFPTSEAELIDEYSRMLFRMSSPLPAHLAKFAGDKGYSISDGSRGFIFNGDPQCVVDFFEIGTRPKLVADR
ncbi:MAG: vWA domain-containing protein [Xanthobacteraceae bacterium]